MATIWYCLGIQQQPHVSAWGLVGCLLCFSWVGLCRVGYYTMYYTMCWVGSGGCGSAATHLTPWAQPALAFLQIVKSQVLLPAPQKLALPV